MNKQQIAIMIFASASLGMTTAAVAQQSGVSKPPSDMIETTPDSQPVAQQQPMPKPSAGVVAQPADGYATPQAYTAPQGGYSAPQQGYPQQGYPQQGYSQDPSQQQVLVTRQPVPDPDGDIVHPLPARPGELMEGSTIRVRLMQRISSGQTEKGEPFSGQVANDVLQNGRVLIPAGSGIEGRVSAVSTGQHLGGHGSFRLKPEVVILPDGSRFQLHAQTTGTPGSKTRIGSEGTVNPGSRAKKDGIEYGAVMGTGAITGAVLGGPVGALAGTLVGAGVVTTHLAVDHPQATLEPGSILLFTLTEPMNLMPQTN